MAYHQKWFDGETIKITIQENESTSIDFHVPKALVMARSKYFAALPNFKEGQDNHIKFNSWGIEAFRYVLTWMYQGRIEVLYDGFETMVRAYVIADFLMMSKLKNAIIDNIRKVCQYVGKGAIEADDLCLLKELGLPVTDKLIQFGTDSAAFEIAQEAAFSRRILGYAGLKSFVRDGGEMALEVVEKSLRYLQIATEDGSASLDSDRNPAAGEGCHYHVHGEEEVYEEGECSGRASRTL